MTLQKLYLHAAPEQLQDYQQDKQQSTADCVNFMSRLQWIQTTTTWIELSL